MTIRVLVAEDMRILREALVTLLDAEDDLEVVAAIANGNEIVPQALRHRPDVAVLDIELPGQDGITAAGALRDELPSCRTVILTAVGRPGRLRRGIDAGIDGFLVKDAPPEALADAIRAVMRGEKVIDPQLAFTALHGEPSPLTDRERDVLRLTADGASPREIAATLHLTYGTVRNYLAAAVTKLGARNRVDAIRVATEAGWL